MIELLNVCCMTYIATLNDNAFNLCVVDPPYGIGINSMNMRGRQTIKPDDKVWDKEIPTDEYFKQICRISENQIIWGGGITLSYHLQDVF